MFVRLKLGSEKSAAAVEEQSPVAEVAREESSASPRSTALLEKMIVTTPELPQNRGPRIKTYQVGEVRQAMAAARRELGGDAILIQTKRLDPPQNGMKYEVTFGVAGEGTTPSPVTGTASQLGQPALTAQTQPNDPHWSEEFARVRADIAALHSMLSKRYWDPATSLDPTRETVKFRNQLVQHGVDPDLASEWLAALEDTLTSEDSKPSFEVIAKILLGHLGSRVRVDASLGWDTSLGKAMMLIGPPASGKTTALLKLALEYGVKRGRDVEIWSLDHWSSDTDSTVQSFCHLLNIPMRSFRSAGGMMGALGKIDLSNRLVLIDTKGYGGKSTDADGELSSTLAGSELIDCQLVLSTAWHPTALASAVDRFEVFQPSRLMFTMLDQSCTFGSLLQEPWRTRKTLSFVSEGGLGAGTIRVASLESILEKIASEIE